MEIGAYCLVWLSRFVPRSRMQRVKLNVHVISLGLREVDKAKLRRSWEHPNCGRVSFAEIAREKFRSFRSTLVLKSKAVYCRYYIGDMFPNLKRCIYLDTDLLVFRDLTEAFRMDLGDNVAAAVLDFGTRVKPVNPALKRRLALRDERKYFNSGFMIMELDVWRREQLSDKLAETSIQRYDQMHHDQDVLNVVLEDRIFSSDESWNTSHWEMPSPLTNRIVHLMGTVKPWHASYKIKYREAYFDSVIFQAFMDVIRRTAFRGWERRNFSKSARFIEFVDQNMPTLDMIVGKLRRVARHILGKAPRIFAARRRGS